MYRAFSLIVLTLATLSLSAPYGAEAATDPIADFCASPTALADAQAQRECQDLVALQASNAKIKGEKDSIEKEVKDIDGQIAIAQQKIKVQNTIIATLTKDIGTKTVKINGLQAKIDQDVDSVTDLIQKVNQQDAVSVVSVLLGNKSFSDFYIELDTLHALNKQLTNLISEVRSNKVETESEKQSLQDRKDKETDAKVAIEAEKRLIDRKKAEKAALLASKTADYTVAQKLLTEQKQKVAQIRARLFKFQDGEGIPFGDAYDYAARAARVTGVRPAFLLAIITQESSFDSADSSFGKNIGQCYLRDTSTGAGVSVASGAARSNVMHPTRDVPVFLQIATFARLLQTEVVSAQRHPSLGAATEIGPARDDYTVIEILDVAPQNQDALVTAVSGSHDWLLETPGYRSQSVLRGMRARGPKGGDGGELKALGLQIGDGQLGAVGAQHRGDVIAEAACGAGHNRDFVFQHGFGPKDYARRSTCLPRSLRRICANRERHRRNGSACPTP